MPFDQFGRAWDPGDDKPTDFQRECHARNIRGSYEVVDVVEQSFAVRL